MFNVLNSDTVFIQYLIINNTYYLVSLKLYYVMYYCLLYYAIIRTVY